MLKLRNIETQGVRHTGINGRANLLFLIELEDDRFNPTMVPEFEPVACCAAAGLVVFFVFLDAIARKLGISPIIFKNSNISIFIIL